MEWGWIIFIAVILWLMTLSSNQEKNKIAKLEAEIKTMKNLINQNVLVKPEDFMVLFEKAVREMDEKQPNDLGYAYLSSVYRELPKNSKEMLRKQTWMKNALNYFEPNDIEEEIKTA